MHEFQERARTLVQDGTLELRPEGCAGWPRWPPRRCPTPTLSPDCREALDKRVICDMYEGNAPYTARYILPDYERALRQGLQYLEMPPPTNLDDALAVPAGDVRQRPQRHHLPGVPGRPRHGARPVRHRRHRPTTNSTRSCAASGSASTACCPTRSCTSTSARTTAASPAAIFRVERSLRQSVPNITLKVDPAITPDSLVEDGVLTVFETGKPHFVNHPMMVGDHGERYAAVSCYNSLKIGGGAHTLVRLNLKEAALRHVGSADAFLTTTLPRYVELTAELAEARIRSLVEDQHFYDTHWLAREGLIDIDRFSAMFGIFGLAECVNLLMDHDGPRRADVRPRRRRQRVRPSRGRARRRTGRRARRCPTATAAAAAPTCTARAASTWTTTSRPAPASPWATSPTCSPTCTTCAPHHRLFSVGHQRHLPHGRDRGAQPAGHRRHHPRRVPPGHARLHVQPRLERVRPHHRLPRPQERPGRPSPNAVRARHGSDHLAAGAREQLPPHPAQREADRTAASDDVTDSSPTPSRSATSTDRATASSCSCRAATSTASPATTRRPFPSATGDHFRTLASTTCSTQIRRAEPFLGGITVSGGEATLQADFVHALFTAVKGDPQLRRLSCFVDSNGAADAATLAVRWHR